MHPLLRRIERAARRYLGFPKLGVTHAVELTCPHTGHTIGTEHSLPDYIERADGDDKIVIACYNCPACKDVHEYEWGLRDP